MSSKSLIPTHHPSFPSFDEPNLPLADLTSIFYDDSARPFPLFGLSFSELPEATRTFLMENAARLPTRLCLSKDEDGLSAYFEILLRFREEEQARLGRTLEGVHRAIVRSMFLAKTSSPVDAHAQAEEAETELRTILLPEWRSHLDSHLTRIDALIWFEMEMRRGTAVEMGYEQCVRERREDVQRMVVFAVRGLQGVHEQVRERGERELMGEVGFEGEGDGELERHISDGSGSSGSSGSGSSGSGSSDEYEYEDADDEESIFSESDFDLGGTTSDSEAQWIDFDSTFTRIGA